jgi:hypothetical protein
MYFQKPPWVVLEKHYINWEDPSRRGIREKKA